MKANDSKKKYILNKLEKTVKTYKQVFDDMQYTVNKYRQVIGRLYVNPM